MATILRKLKDKTEVKPFWELFRFLGGFRKAVGRRIADGKGLGIENRWQAS